MGISASTVKDLAHACGFELVGVAPAIPSDDLARFEVWRALGMAGEMTYLTDRRGDLRGDPCQLLPSAQSIVCVGQLYNTGQAHSSDRQDQSQGQFSRYAWGADYHDVLRRRLKALVDAIALREKEPFESRICVDTAPLLERSYARAAGLGWIGKNTCLINQTSGSWFFLGELLLSIPLVPDEPAPPRCGTCTRCIDACPTNAILAGPEGSTLDARQCISYLTIEHRGPVEPQLAAQTQNHLFGCDICQDVCPWNRRAPVTADPSFSPAHSSLPLEELAALTEEDFRIRFRQSPVRRSKYRGFLRNVAHAMGNSGRPALREPLERLSFHPDTLVATAARTALSYLDQTLAQQTLPGTEMKTCELERSHCSACS